MILDLTPKKSTPWWCLLKCCHPTAAKDHDEEDNGVNGSDSYDDAPRTPLTKKCSAPTTTPPTDRSTPLKPIQEDDEHSSMSSFNHFFLDEEDISINDSRPSTPKMDFVNGIGLFLTLAAAAQQTSTLQCASKFQQRENLFDDSFDLKEITCNVLN